MSHDDIIAMAVEVGFNPKMNHSLRRTLIQFAGLIQTATLEATAIAAEPQPAVWMQSDHLNKFIHQHCGSDSMLARCSHRQLMTDYQPLYTAPVAAQREWVGLTEEDIFDEWGNCQPIDH